MNGQCSQPNEPCLNTKLARDEPFTKEFKDEDGCVVKLEWGQDEFVAIKIDGEFFAQENRKDINEFTENNLIMWEDEQ